MIEEDIDVVCLYGTDLQGGYPQVAEWLNQKEERRLLYILEESDHVQALFQDSKVRFLFAGDEESFKQAAWEFVFLKFSYLALCPPEKKERADELFCKMQHYQSGVHLVASDFRDFGVRILSNVYANMSRFCEAKRGRALFNRFKGIPAIICGAGPTLEREIEALGKLQNNALLFAGGSALNILAQEKITPHFAASIDPDPPHERLKEQASFNSPFFYQSRVSQELLASIHAPLFWMEGSGGYPIEEWLQKECGIEEHLFDGGWNVATFCTALSVALGCNPIIFVGVDLASDGEKLYAAGVEEKVEGLLPVLDAAGKKAFARRDWLFAKDWLEKFEKAHPEHTFIQTKSSSLTLHKAVFEQEWDLHKLVDQEIKKISAIGIEKRKIEEMLHKIECSLKRCDERIEKLLALFEERFPGLPSETGEGALLEVELEEELAFQNIIEPLWKVWQPIWTRKSLEISSPHTEEYLQRLLFYKKVVHEMQKI